MLSYKADLSRIGIAPGTPVSYQRTFYTRPNSLRQAIRSMRAPQDWGQVSDISLDENWTEECQGVAWDGGRWIFSSNGSTALGSSPKALYVFNGGTPLHDDNIVRTFRFEDRVPSPGRLHHIGQITYYNGFIYVAHFNDSGAQVIVVRDDNGNLSYANWIELERPTSPTDGRVARAEFQGINPWDGMLYTCFGDQNIYEFFIHDPNTGRCLRDSSGNLKVLRLDPPVSKVQGACFSPNGHLYIATNQHVSDEEHQPIWYYSALNGHRLGVIPVLADQPDDQELEGICYADLTSSGGQRVQIHAVLLDNHDIAKDNIFFKSFSTSTPADV